MHKLVLKFGRTGLWDHETDKTAGYVQGRLDPFKKHNLNWANAALFAYCCVFKKLIRRHTCVWSLAQTKNNYKKPSSVLNMTL